MTTLFVLTIAFQCWLRTNWSAMNYRNLLIKYISHVAVAEGESFALSVDLSPADMGELEFTDEEKRLLEASIFPEVKQRLGE